MSHFSPLRPDVKTRAVIEQESGSGFYRCWSCGACDGGCPVNIDFNSLRPQKIVRLAYIGLLDELLGLPEIWYCLTCRRCGFVCPNLVKPFNIIEYVRGEMLRRGRVTRDAVHRYQQFFAMFQRVRWHAVSVCFNGSLDSLSESQWKEWLTTPIPMPSGKISGNGIPVRKTIMGDAHPSLCFTCSECSGVCPIFCERGLFDPQAIIRMFNLKLTEELLTSPSIWLCLGCERCADACSQTVKGHRIIKQLQDLAISEGVVDTFLVSRIRQADKIIYQRFFREIDAIFNLPTAEKDHSHFDKAFPEPSHKIAETTLPLSIHSYS
jgi:heterodisulfide reductase subunit C